MTEKGSVKSAVERAMRLTNPATSEEEDARTLAQLLHVLRSQERDLVYEKRANLWDDDRPIQTEILLPDGKRKTIYVENEQGEGKTPDGEKCLTIGQRLERLRKGQDELWEQAEEEGLDRKVTKALGEVQDRALERAKAAEEAEASSNGDKPKD
jgi:hypothetical protein